MDASPSPKAVANFMARDREFHNRLLELAENDLVTDSARFISHAIFAMGLIRTVELGVHEHMEIPGCAGKPRSESGPRNACAPIIHRSVEWLTQEAEEEDRKKASRPNGTGAD